VPSFNMFLTLNLDQKLGTLLYGHQTFPHHTNQKIDVRTAKFAGDPAWCHVDMNGTTVGANVITYTEELCLAGSFLTG
jgi:hypothetical protein